MSDANTANDAEIRRQSEGYSVLFLIGAVFMAGTLVAGHVLWPLTRVLGGALEGDPWRDVLRDVGLNLVSALPALLLLLGVLAAQRVFSRMSEGAIFTSANVADIGRIGENMVWAAIAAIIISPSISGWIRGDIHPNVRLHDWALLLALLGAAIGVMGRVLGLASAIKAEHDQIV